MLLLLALGGHLPPRLGRLLVQALGVLPREVPVGVHLLPRARAGLGGEGEVHRHRDRAGRGGLALRRPGGEAHHLREVDGELMVREGGGAVGRDAERGGLVDRLAVFRALAAHERADPELGVPSAPGVVQANLPGGGVGRDGELLPEPLVPAGAFHHQVHGVPRHVLPPLGGEHGQALGALDRAELLGEAALVVGADRDGDGRGAVRQGAEVHQDRLAVGAAVVVEIHALERGHLPVGAGGQGQSGQQRNAHGFFLGSGLTQRPVSRRFLKAENQIHFCS